MRRLVLRAMQIYQEGYAAWLCMKVSTGNEDIFAMQLADAKERWDRLPQAVREIARGLVRRGYTP